MLSSIIFSNNLFFLCLLVALLSTIVLYYSQRNFLKSQTLYFLSLVRFVSITFLCFLLLDPVVKSINKLKEEPIVVILQDESSSIKEDLRRMKTIHIYIGNGIQKQFQLMVKNYK